MKKIALMFLVALSFATCKKDTPVATKIIIEHDTIQHAWQPEPRFNGQAQDISVVSVSGGTVFFNSADNGYMTYDSTHNQWGIGLANFYTTPYIYSKPAVNKLFYASIKYSNNVIELMNPYNGYAFMEHEFSPSQYDTNFKSFPALFPYLYENSIDVSDSNRVIIPATVKDSMLSCVYLFDVSPNITSISNFKKVVLYSSPPTICHIGNRFFVSDFSFIAPHSPCTRLIRENFSVKEIPQIRFSSIFKYNGTYYAVGNGSSIYQTTDLGETWTQLYNLNQNALFTSIDNKLLALSGSQLWEVTLTPTSITFKEIVNDGLIGKTITGIVKCNNTVWITTNGGVFYRPYSSFYQYK